jgi:hypothetical protein
MSRKSLVGPALIVLVVAAGLSIWLLNRPDPIPTEPPASAPALDSCWAVDIAATQGTMPWPGRPVACTAPHTAEVYHVGQVDKKLISDARGAKGSQATIANSLMYAQARRACGLLASTYLGGNWHQGQVTVLANWIAPAKDGFFGCALAQTADPAGAKLVSRTSAMKSALTGGTGPLAINCVTRGADGTMRYSSCDQPHDGELMGLYTVIPQDAPFDAAKLKTAVTDGCGQAATQYLGLPAGSLRHDLSVGYVGPTTASTWLGSDQTFACYGLARATVRGSLHGLGTRPLPH